MMNDNVIVPDETRPTIYTVELTPGASEMHEVVLLSEHERVVTGLQVECCCCSQAGARGPDCDAGTSQPAEQQPAGWFRRPTDFGSWVECDPSEGEATPLYAVPVMRAVPTDDCSFCRWVLTDMYGNLCQCCRIEPALAQDDREAITGGAVTELLTSITMYGSEMWAEGRGGGGSELMNARAAYDDVYRLVQIVAAKGAKGVDHG